MEKIHGMLKLLKAAILMDFNMQKIGEIIKTDTKFIQTLN